MKKFNPKLVYSECFGVGDYPCEDVQSKDGKMLVPVNYKDVQYFLYSEDNGKSFRRIESKSARHEKFRQLSDGSFLGFGFQSVYAGVIFDRETKEDVPFGLAVYRADSIEDIIAEKIRTDVASVHIPGLCFGYGDSGNVHTGCVSGWRELSNGDVYVTMYGQFRDDTCLCEYFKDNCDYDFYLYRTWSIVSHDKGKTWEFVTTIADCQTYPITDMNAEGYCEADIEEVEEGHLVCVLRTEGHEVYSPLYVCHSHDFGKTWTKPVIFCDWGVLPKLVKMKDGTLVCASGHWHTMLLFSDDNGMTWSEPFIVEFCDGRWDKSAPGYVSFCESAPGEISIVFADPKEGIANNMPEGEKRWIYHRRYAIENE